MERLALHRAVGSTGLQGLRSSSRPLHLSRRPPRGPSSAVGATARTPLQRRLRVTCLVNADASDATPIRDHSATGFDLSMAVALAAAAFEAYLEPTGAEGFQERSMSGTTVTYTDRSYLVENFDGVLQLVVHSAKGLKAVNIFGNSDPYVLATLGDSSGRTTVKPGAVDCTWDEHLLLYVRDAGKDVLRLRVLDQGGPLNLPGQSDADLGTVMVPLAQLAAAPEEPLFLDLQLRGPEAQGSLSISATFLPFEDRASTAVEAVVAEGGMVAPTAPQLLPTDVEEAAKQMEDSIDVVVQQVEVAVGAATEHLAAAQEAVKGVADTAGGHVAAAHHQVGDAVEAASEHLAAAHKKVEGAIEAASVQLEQTLQSPEVQQAVAHLASSAQETVVKAGGAVGGKLAALPVPEPPPTWAEGDASLVASAAASVMDMAQDFVSGRSLGSLPIADLTALLSSIGALRGGPSGGAAAAAGEAVAAGAAASKAGGDVATTTAAAAASAALDASQLPTAWRALATVAGKVLDEAFRTVAFIDNPETDTQVWVYVARDKAEVIVSFRGTEQVKWKDLVSDLNLIPTTLDAERTGSISLGLGGVPLPFAAFKKGTDIMVHSGFLGAYDSVKVTLLRLVDQLTGVAGGAGAGEAGTPWDVFVTGHSLGGALATLFAYELAGRRPAKQGVHSVAMYTYGSPRVGNAAFADAFNARVRSSWRFYNSSDIVPSVPRLMGYSHVRTGVQLLPNGGLMFQEGSQDVLGEGREVAEVLQDLAAQAQAGGSAGRSLDSVVSEITDHEMALLATLVDGSALAQHMEDWYLLSLKECVMAADPSLRAQFDQVMSAGAAAAPAGSDAAAPGGDAAPPGAA